MKTERVVTTPYCKLAQIYDEVMDHVDYSHWANLVIQVLIDCGLNPYENLRVLENACGTGNIAIALSTVGYDVTANDLNEAMVKVAKSKAKANKTKIQFSTQGFLDLNSQNEYSAIIALYDSVNYLLELHLLRDYFKRVSDALVEDGVFLFDICTERNSLLYFLDRVERGSGENFKYKRHVRYNEESKIQENKFQIVFSDDNTTWEELHRQKIYSVKEVKEALHSCNFKIIEIFDEFNRGAVTKNSLRAHFVCRKGGV